MDRTDEDLIAAFQIGNMEALVMLFERYKRPVLNFSLRYLGNRADAEDVTGEVFTILLSKSHMFKPCGKFSTWLFTITRNVCISKIRQRKPMVSLWFTKDHSNTYEQWEIPDTNALAPEEITKQETASMVKKAITKLPDNQREALILREYHDLSYNEIAQIMECSLENVKILIFRARERLRSELLSMEEID